MDMIVLIFVVLKVGLVYVLIDLEYLIQWMQYFFCDSGVKVFFIQKKLKVLVEEVEFDGVIVFVDEEESYYVDV